MYKLKVNQEILEKYNFKNNIRDDYRINSRVIIDDDKIIHLVLYSNPSRLPLEIYQENIIEAYIDDLIKDNLVEKTNE